ncbi:MAG: hypothetical protein M1819_001127 [Sarea resinae]|nr:MAG: hypothetical protein M1819_001127 [Sarea resinae]
MADYPGCSSSFSSLENKSFDVIVVGGGTAGLVVAARLSENPNVKVLVIEAGANRVDDPKIYTPGLVATLYSDPTYDWDFLTVPQPHLNNRQVGQPRGKVLGGSSALNFGLILYPSKANLNGWAALGNPTWDGDSMAQYYRKFQTYHEPSAETRELLSIDYMDPKLQGDSGPLQVSFGDQYNSFNKAWVDTFTNLNHKITGDPITGEHIGGFACSASIDPKTKTRSYSVSAYYSPEIAKRPNLTVLTEALVEKVLLDGKDSDVTATGVQIVTKDGERHQVSAKEEVILACGVLQSPQILELSGIGGKELLSKHGIPVVIDNPYVGENLQDHAFASLSFEVADGQTTADALRDPNLVQALVTLYESSRTGPLSGSTLACSYLPLVDINGITDPKEFKLLLDKYLADGQYPEFPARKQQFDLLRKMLENPKESSGEYMLFPFQLNVSEGATPMAELAAPSTPGQYISIGAVLNHPFSRGSVHITTADPAVKPRYDPNYMSHPLDLEVLGRHMQFIEKFVATEPMKSLLKKDGRRIPSNASALELDAAKELVRRRQMTTFHPSGSCAMMSRELGGVVSDRLIVHGTKNLRVVDASIFPLEPLGNIQGSVYAVAEKAADVIKEDWKKSGKA